MLAVRTVKISTSNSYLPEKSVLSNARNANLWNGKKSNTREAKSLQTGRRQERTLTSKMYVENQEYLMIQEYGYHLYGWLPTGEVTAIVHSQGEYVPSHINEYILYDETPLKDALEEYVRGDKEDMEVPDYGYWNSERREEYFHQSGSLRPALSGLSALWWDYKNPFKEKVLNGDIHLGDTPAIFNRYGDVYVHEDETESVRKQFKEFAKTEKNQ